MDFQHRLYKLRKKAGLSQEDLADLVGVSRQAVQKWESGSSRPDLDNLMALAEYFQVPLDYLAAGKEAPPPPRSETVVHHYYDCRWHWEYKSERTLFGLPLIHINCGPGLRRAKGIIAVGNLATGFVAVGGLALGLVPLGGLSLGLLAFGGLAVGCVALGGVAVGLLALAGIALGVLTCGGISCGLYAFGGVASAAKVAIGGVASGAVAVGAAADGPQSFPVPPGGLHGVQLDAVRQAIAGVCQGEPAWLIRLLCYLAERAV